ncbi:hypothetical protein KBB96_10520 [Luteolibacter ambystomatis]|uniref:Uncharacterized protein n=1 Tax=Luteolibacter ambystomatis TaxID=2824561 RepID=A0A975IZ43_9BACT|nr:hypothetical protein [Luteolibacter ambystomatis]QUE49305.1 hypothetical protein KBB96_10520 [Luteolibacter ambystomatis]
MIAIQFSSVEFIGRRLPFHEIWEDIGEGFMAMLRGRFDPVPFMAGGIFVTIHLFVLAQPFLTGFYSRARLLLWIARVISLVPWGWLIVSGGFSSMIRELPYSEVEPMAVCALAVITFLPIGLFLVPAREREQFQEGIKRREQE